MGIWALPYRVWPCVVCERRFKLADRRNSPCCSDKCLGKFLASRACKQCGIDITHTANENSVVCGSPECRQAYRKATSLRRSKIVYDKITDDKRAYWKLARARHRERMVTDPEYADAYRERERRRMANYLHNKALREGEAAIKELMEELGNG